MNAPTTITHKNATTRTITAGGVEFEPAATLVARSSRRRFRGRAAL